MLSSLRSSTHPPGCDCAVQWQTVCCHMLSSLWSPTHPSVCVRVSACCLCLAACCHMLSSLWSSTHPSVCDWVRACCLCLAADCHMSSLRSSTHPDCGHACCPMASSMLSHAVSSSLQPPTHPSDCVTQCCCPKTNSFIPSCPV